MNTPEEKLTMSSPPPVGKPASRTGLSVSRFIALLVLVCGTVVCADLAIRNWRKCEENQPLKPLAMKGQWIKAPGDEIYSGCFIREFHLSGNVRCAWLAIASTDEFDVTVNGRPVGWVVMWRPTRPFQNDLSQVGQRLHWPLSVLSLNFAREYQWEDHRSYMLPLFTDITRYLSPGKNVICVDLRSRHAPAELLLDGGIELWTGEKLSVNSGPDWRAEPVPPDAQHPDWRSHNFDSQSWRHAEVAAAPPGELYRTFDTRIYQTAFHGQWLRHPGASAQDSIWFQKVWQCDRKPEEAWIRLATNRRYEIYINDRRAFIDTPDSSGLENGEWIYNQSRDFDPLTLPENLDPNEVGSLFLRQSFSTPRNSNFLESIDDKKVVGKPPLPSAQLNAEKSAAGLVSAMPKSLAKDNAEGAFVAYNLSNLLQEGRNTITIRLTQSDNGAEPAWAGQIAVDGEASYADGTRDAIESDGTWNCWIAGQQRTGEKSVAAQPFRMARQIEKPLCSLVYRGTPEFRDTPIESVDSTIPTILAALFGIVLLLGAIRLGFYLFWKKHSSGLTITPVNFISLILWDAMLAFTVTIGSLILLKVVNGERSEQLWFLLPEMWKIGLEIAASLAIVAGLVRLLRLSGIGFLRTFASRTKHWTQNLPNTWLWVFLIIWISIFSFFIRAYNLDFQPLDDDEYPSVQGIISIAREGVPSYVPAPVWYTRSPFYHYLTGAVVWMFGENIWSLRLPAAFFGVATGILFYLCGSRLLGRPWVGMAALIMATLHPHIIFTSHMVRFYQQQQFFSLLMAYFFCKGFVTDQSQRYRYLTLVAFLAATLSQEITAVAAVSLVFGYVLFAENKSWKDNLKLFIVTVCVVAVIAVDFLVYETRCMTRLEGISPSMQADVGPHLWLPYNFLSLFLGYSRLHLFFSVLFFLGLPAALRERNRVSYALHFLFFSGVILINLLITQVSLRYQYWLMPLLMLLSIDNARAGLAWLSSLGTQHSHRKRSLGFAPALCMTVLLVGVVLSWSPWRIPPTYDTKMLADSTGSFQYIRTQLRPGDIVMATQPHAKATLIETGRSDYEVHIPIIYDFVLRDDDTGKIIDRGAGAEAVTSVKQLQEICMQHKRVWIAINREKQHSQGKKIFWQYPGARMEVFLRKNLQLMHRTHLWDVFLWDADRAHYVPFRNDDI